ncbi:Rossmann-like and DUF2520 domain-containing protein [Rothia sp. P7181]|uniref:Rossmann-like and DUF2520 domain-containing protein n=1 Tax=Rothia sp. P7181 TaxID=3402663 RepID=UPI003ADB5E3C
MSFTQPARMKIGVISAGKVGAVLGAALRAAQHTIVGVHAISEASRERAEMLLPGVPLRSIPDIVQEAEVVLLAVPDDTITSVVEGIAHTVGWKNGQIVFHTSGMHGISVLEPAAAQGAICLAIHPAMTFTGLSLDLARLQDTCCAVTGPAPFLPIAQALSVEMGAEPVTIAETDRGLYHAALAHVANHLVTITGQSLQILESIGVPQPAHYLRPLLQAALDNVLSSGENMLTGPVARADIQTVHTHAQELSQYAQEENSEDISIAYIALAQATAQRAHARGALNDEQLERVLDALQR